MQLNQVQYSAEEAAQKLGIDIKEFSELVRSYIAEDLPPSAVFHPSDLIVLRVMASKAGNRPAVA